MAHVNTASSQRQAARDAVRNQYLFVANEEEAFSVFGRSEVQDINRIRGCTDVPYLLAFLGVCVIMAALDYEARSSGNVLRLSEPIDFEGNLCGYDDEVKDKPLGYHPNPYNDMIVCVSACPKTAADGMFTLPDGPMGKFYTRHAYPTSKIFGQYCLPLDLNLAKRVISTKSFQTEMYKAMGTVFNSTSVIFILLIVPFVTSLVYVVMILFIPFVASTIALSMTSVTMALVGFLSELDADVLYIRPLYAETHPVMVACEPYFRGACYTGAVAFAVFTLIQANIMQRSGDVFKECMSAIINTNVLIALFTSVAISIIRIIFILHITKHAALLMSIIRPVEVKLELFGEWRFVQRNAWSPYFFKWLWFYAFGSFWILEFLSYANKYITAQILCHNYFMLSARNEAGMEMRHGKGSPLYYAVVSLFRFHLGSVAFGSLLAAPCRACRFIILLFVPDKPNLLKSINRLDHIAHYLFWPLIQLNLLFLRFFKDSVWVILPLKGYPYMDAARRSEGLLNRCRGKIPNLTKFTGKVDMFLNVSVGLSSVVWGFFLFREPRYGRYHQVENIRSNEAVDGLFQQTEHSPLLCLPVMFAFGLWVGNGMLHLIGMASNALTVCYCIDVEMAGGTETDALYVPLSLKEVYKNLGGGESERELSEMIAQGITGG